MFLDEQATFLSLAVPTHVLAFLITLSPADCKAHSHRMETALPLSYHSKI